MAAASAFDELWGTSRSKQARPEFEPLAQWLTDLPPAEIDRRQQAAEAAFRSLGITFAVYGDEEAAERIIPFDIIPRIFTAREWDESLGRARAEGTGDQRLHRRRLRRPPHPRRRRDPARHRPRQQPVLHTLCRFEAAARRLCPHLRHRPGAHRRRRILGARGQCPHALGRLLHAREPGGDAAALPRTVRDVCGAAGRFLPRAAPRNALFGGAGRVPPAGLRAADAGPFQLGLLRAQLPRRQYGDRAGRGPRSHRRRRQGLDADDRRSGAGRRHLSPDRRRLSRSSGVRAEVDPRRARPPRRLSGRQRRSGERARDRHRRRQGDLQLHAGDRALLYRRRAEASQRRDLALPRAEGAEPCPRKYREDGGEAGRRLGRLRHAGRPDREQEGDRGVP